MSALPKASDGLQAGILFIVAVIAVRSLTNHYFYYSSLYFFFTEVTISKILLSVAIDKYCHTPALRGCRAGVPVCELPRRHGRHTPFAAAYAIIRSTGAIIIPDNYKIITGAGVLRVGESLL